MENTSTFINLDVSFFIDNNVDNEVLGTPSSNTSSASPSPIKEDLPIESNWIVINAVRNYFNILFVSTITQPRIKQSIARLFIYSIL